ncbi:MAG: ComF family protein [Candidatus Omnitrophota bacterium]
MSIGWFEAVQNIFFPHLCLYCENKIPNGFLCSKCEQKIHLLYSPLCQYCSKPIKLSPLNICKECQGKIHPYDRAISAAAYKEPIVSLIRLFKYKNYSWLASFFTQLIIKQLSETDFNPSEYDLIIPVPMHKYKLKMRGYNQAALLAKPLSKYFKIPFEDGIMKSIDFGPSQTKLSRGLRQKNVEKAFTATENLNNKKIILVDDIFTTGSTAASCCRELKNAQSGLITVITASKTIH